MFARLPIPCLFINVMVPQISVLYLHCAIKINHIFQPTLYIQLIQSILPMQNITPSGGNTFFPPPRFQLILCHTFVLCNDTVAYAQMLGQDGGASLRFSHTTQLATLLALLWKSSPAKLTPGLHCDFPPPSPPRPSYAFASFGLEGLRCRGGKSLHANAPLQRIKVLDQYK